MTTELPTSIDHLATLGDCLAAKNELAWSRMRNQPEEIQDLRQAEYVRALQEYGTREMICQIEELEDRIDTDPKDYAYLDYWPEDRQADLIRLESLQWLLERVGIND